MEGFMELIQIKDLSFTYDNYRYVLRDINLSFQAGKIYGIFGKSGAGKSTLLSLLAGLEKYTTGSICYDGTELMNLNRDFYRCHDIGIIFQSYNLLPYLTAMENVILSMDISGVKVEHKKEYALSLLEKVGLDSSQANRPILKLSGGEQQRVSIARALSYNCKVILADEPTGNLDKETEQEILELLVRLAHQEKKCVIIISHSPIVKEITDRTYQLSKGKIEEQK